MTGERKSPALKVLPTVIILLVTWVLMWLAQGIAGVCALAHPCPAPDVRVAPALLFGGLMLIPAAVLVVTAWGNHSVNWVRVLSYVLLIGLAIIGMGAVLFSGGFSVF